MLRAILIILLASNASLAFCQLTLEECRQKARANYPLVRQYELIELTTKYTLRNVARENLPQISLSGKVSYQSEVTEIPIQLSDVSIEPLSKDQYQIGIEIQQNLWDGGRIRNEKQLSKASADENSRQVDVDMYALNNRVDEVFFSILLLISCLREKDMKVTDVLRRRFLEIGTWVKANKKNADIAFKIGAIILMAIYTYLMMEFLPFWAASVIFLLALFFYLRAGKWWKNVLVAVLGVVTVVVIFQYCFNAALP